MKLAGTDTSPDYADLRARAERRLATSHRPILTPVPSDPARLVHELTLQRAELEVQNDELRETELQLLDANQRYRSLYDDAPIAYVTLDQRGRIVEANARAAELLATSRRCLVGVPFSRLLSQPDADRFHLHRWEVVSAGERRTTAFDIQRPDCVRLTVRMESTAITTTAGTECRVALIDVTEQQRIERRLVDRERELSALLEAVADGVLSFDAEGTVRWVSAGVAELLGFPRSELVGRSFGELLAELSERGFDVRVRKLGEHGFVATVNRV